MILLDYLKLTSFLTLFALTACMHPISEQTRRQVAPQTTLTMVKADPAAFVDQQLLLGGVIVDSQTDGEETVLEVMQWRLNRWGEPTSMTEDENRFLLKTERALDPAIFEPGVLVTLAGVVLGQETRLLDEHAYSYPVLKLSEIHAWQSPFRYGIHRYPGPDYPHYVGDDGQTFQNPYDPGYSVYPYTQHWYRIAR